VRFCDFLKERVPQLKIVLTVSPVPLHDTFSGIDILTANSYSKATLRAVAQDVADEHEYIDYFPSYELVTLANPDSAWYPDRRHVQREFVAKIMERFSEIFML
jgi:hypothetical protein